MKSISTIILLLSVNFGLAQYPSIKWEYPLSAPAFGSAAAADLDNDGFLEIVFSTYTNDGKAHCLNAEDGTVKWTYDLGGCGDVAPLIYDFNSDGIMDVVINGSCNPTVFCIQGDSGELLWSQPSGGGDSPPTVSDIDKDGKPEVLFGNFSGEIRIHNGEDGSLLKSILADPFQGPIQTAPSLVDVNEDGNLDIIVANYANNDGLNLWAIDFNSEELIWTNHVDNEDAFAHAYHAGAIADIDGDEKLEYVVGSGGGLIQAINLNDGSTLWTKNVPTSNISAISIADLDQDDVPEIIFNNSDSETFDPRIWVLSGDDGETEWSYPINFTSFRGMAISDINGNGKLDLISGHFLGILRVIEPYTGIIWELDLQENFPPGLPYFDVDHGPLIADFDKNNTIDIFTVAGYGTYTPDEQNIGKAFMIEAGIGTCPEWLMFRQDPLRTGYMSGEDINSSCNTTPVKEQPSLESNQVKLRTNPVQDEINIEVFSKEGKEIGIEIFNLSGKKITGSWDYQLTGSTNKIDMSLPENILNGMYLLRLQIDNKRPMVRKFVVAK